jgi:hypothetical protein
VTQKLESERSDPDGRHQRMTMLLGVVISFPAAITLWFGTYHALPRIARMESPGDRMAFALKMLLRRGPALLRDRYRGRLPRAPHHRGH